MGFLDKLKRCAVAVVLGLTSATVQAASLTLDDWVFNIDGVVHEAFLGDPLPTTGELVDGLGTLSLEVSGAGSHSIIGFFDFEINQYSNTFFNESGAAIGIPDQRQSWEIDEPKYFFGDILDNVFLGSLDNTNGVPSGQEDDVGFALGWDFELLAGQTAIIDFSFVDVLPSVDFFLSQTDPGSDYSFYFFSTLDITGGSAANDPLVQVDEPGTSVLVIMASTLGIFLSRHRKSRPSWRA